MKPTFDADLATQAAEAILNRIIEIAPRTNGESVEHLARAYANVVSVSDDDTPKYIHLR